ncbi:hypothetical protein LIV57_03500 [Chryseobacterium sp. X308]|uniref:beta strand repeat-containing protein n=1 Tax=Chryseobacterium sp. X308 TaxID=2884873 RepID=UPI001D1557EE|nr:hypothetical protein [Chryseobacterium sp. X308]MCC3214321.1 hypothetical protein [Chryseobacterium sp. X308]
MMISKKLLVGLLFVNLSLYAQKGNVGINTPNPGTTLDINGAITTRETTLPVSGNTATIPSNVSQVQLTGSATATITITAPAAPNPGQRLIVYNNTTGGFDAILNGTTVSNNKIKEFVFTNSSWRATAGSENTTSPSNIYTTDGSLTGNRTVTQGSNTLAFTGNRVNAFSIDGNTVSVDAANHLLGVGTTNPDTRLTVQTPDNSFGINHSNGAINLKTYIGGGAAFVGTTTANDLNLTTNNTSKVTVTSNGNVGIATNKPDTKLTVQTPDNSFGINHSNGSINLKTYIGGGAAYVGTTTANDLNLTTNNTSKVTVTSNGNVGIATNIPDTKLTVQTPDNSFGINHSNGTINLKTYIGGGAAYVGTTTANNLNLTTNNTPKVTITSNGNVGLNHSNPDRTLDVNGNVRIRKIDFVNTALNSGIVLSDGGGAITQINSTNFINSLKIPNNIFNAEQRSSISTYLAGNGAMNNVKFGLININASGTGTWNASNNTYTVAKTGVYQIVAGVKLENVDPNAAVSLYINAGQDNWAFSGTKLTGNKRSFGGTFVKLLNAGEVISCVTSSGGPTSYTQGVSFLHIIYTSL